MEKCKGDKHCYLLVQVCSIVPETVLSFGFGLRLGCFELRYSLSEGSTCILDCDADVKNMLLVLGVVGKSLVEILVFDKWAGDLVELPTDNVSSSFYTSYSTALVSENYHLGKYGSHDIHSYMTYEWENYIEFVGQVFKGGCADFRDKLKKFSVECGFKLKYLKNDKSRISVECSMKESNGCLWRVVSKLNGDVVDSYKLLPWYIESNLASNPGSVFELEVVRESNRFLRLFIAYDAWIKGFMFCHPMLFIDGTFIKSKYKGTFLSCCAKNGNDVFVYELQKIYYRYKDTVLAFEIVLSSGLGFPETVLLPLMVTYAIVDSETIENWRWFLSILSRILRPQERMITFMPDRHDGILSLFPKCAGKGLKKKIMNLLANCAYTCTTSDFDDCIVEFMDNGRGHVKNFLANLPKENYAIAHFPGKRWGSMSNALSESFNAMVSNSRCMLLMDLLEDIRVQLMVSMAEKKLFGQNIHTILGPKKENELKMLLKKGMHWRISHSDMDVLHYDNRDVFEYVEDYWKAFFIQKHINLDKPNVNNFTNGVRPPITKVSSGRPNKIRNLQKQCYVLVDFPKTTLVLHKGRNCFCFEIIICTHDSSNPRGYLSVLLKLDNLGYVLEFFGSLRVGQ
ncbi:unnamed protein product [Malus baccata var. baccata]